MAAARFEKAARLRHPKEFRRVFGVGRRYVDRHFVVIAADNGLGGARLGLAVSRRRARRAVDRSRIKRLVRESFREHARVLPAVDVVVLARGGTAGQSNAALFASLHRHWQQLLDDAASAERPMKPTGPTHG